MQTSQQLERELNEAKTEVAELNRLMIGWKQRATVSKMDLEASRAEVERLKVTVETQNLLSREEAKIPQRWMTEEEAKNKAEAELKELWVRFDKQMEAEAEVERLRALLKNLTDAVSHRISDDFRPEAARQLWDSFIEATKALNDAGTTLNPDKK